MFCVFFSNCCLCFTLVCYVPCMFFTVEPNEVVIFKSFGKIREVVSESGLHCSGLVCGRELVRVRTCLETLTLNDCSFPDSRCASLKVSAIINYRIVDALQATYAVDSISSFITNQGLEVLRSVCSKFCYKSNDVHEASLMSDAKLIGACMKDLMTDRCKIAGVEICRFELMEFAYHAEIAQSML